MTTLAAAKSAATAGTAAATPVLAWSVPRNRSVKVPPDETVRSSGPPSPPPVFRTPMTSFHRSWRAFVTFFTWLLKLDEADAIFRNIPSYFVDRTLKGHEAEVGGLLSWGRFWRTAAGERRGMGVGALVLLHSEGLAAYRSTGRRSFGIFWKRVREFVVERGMHLLVFFIGAPLILASERRQGLLVKIFMVLLVAAIAVRIPGSLRWLVSQNPQARRWIDGFLKRRQDRIEAREAGEARALLDRAMREPDPLVIPWAALTEASFSLETGFRQIMVYGPPSAYWALAWEDREGQRESAVVSVPVRSPGYPALGFADLRLSAELRQGGPAAIKDEAPLFAAVPGLKDWIEQSAASTAKTKGEPAPGAR